MSFIRLSTKKKDWIRRWESKANLPERFVTTKNIGDLDIEIKAILEHMTKDKEKES